MKALIGKFIRDEDGATAIEYGLIAALIAVAIITAVRASVTRRSGRSFSAVAQPKTRIGYIPGGNDAGAWKWKAISGITMSAPSALGSNN